MLDLFTTEKQALVRCIECKSFAGRSRDRWAVLFMAGKGYCDDERHPGGIWNVEQDIVHAHACPHFVRAEESVIEARKKAIAHYGVEERMAERSKR